MDTKLEYLDIVNEFSTFIIIIFYKIIMINVLIRKSSPIDYKIVVKIYNYLLIKDIEPFILVFTFLTYYQTYY